ncbi:hypothetical protein HOU90_gp082 [Lactobacillus phage Lpa804]|uniref:Uncharacterized protein n=1 Tax=Lactobacillus phage Lpa804 TaxID=2059850 RepID=A0A3S6QAI0_9CAUD|nr:hypothetical protein HOU90_gp082 [Lactobacillus phage Lpa804]AUG84684.1 hypothetical protein Lpa804_159 [Lactobacillus phage Lpa804]
MGQLGPDCEWQESNPIFKGYEPFVIFRFTPPQCSEWDLNPHVSRHKILNLARLPITSSELIIRIVGFEPTTSRFQAERPTKLAYILMILPGLGSNQRPLD